MKETKHVGWFLAGHKISIDENWLEYKDPYSPLSVACRNLGCMSSQRVARCSGQRTSSEETSGR